MVYDELKRRWSIDGRECYRATCYECSGQSRLAGMVTRVTTLHAAQTLAQHYGSQLDGPDGWQDRLAMLQWMVHNNPWCRRQAMGWVEG